MSLHLNKGMMSMLLVSPHCDEDSAIVYSGMFLCDIVLTVTSSAVYAQLALVCMHGDGCFCHYICIVIVHTHRQVDRLRLLVGEFAQTCT